MRITTISIVIMVITMTSAGFAQDHSCCTASKTFASLASDARFVAAHAEPMRMQYPTAGEMRSVDVPGGKPTAFYSYALQAGIEAGPNATAVVMYYGMPEKKIERLKALRAPVLAIFASKDDWITPAVAKQFEQDMGTAGSYNNRWRFLRKSDLCSTGIYAEKVHERLF